MKWRSMKRKKPKSSVKKHRQMLAQVARDGKQKIDSKRIIKNTSCVFAPEVSFQEEICKLVFEDDGRIKQQLFDSDELVRLERIDFSEVEDKESGDDCRYQIVVKTNGELWKKIKAALKADPSVAAEPLLNVDCIDIIKILIGGLQCALSLPPPSTP